MWEELLVIAIDNLLGYLVQKSTANWLKTLIFPKTKVESRVVKLRADFGYKLVSDKIARNRIQSKMSFYIRWYFCGERA